MPSLALGKLLSSGSSKTHTAADGATKKSRSRSSSEKRVHDHGQSITQLPTPPVIDRSTSESYFNAAKRRTATFGDNVFNDTDDYGFPVAEYTQSPTDVDSFIASLSLTKGKCRICEKEFQTTSTSTWRCDQCSAVNALKSQTSRSDHDRNTRPLSVARTQDVLERLIRDGLKKWNEKRVDSALATPSKHSTTRTDLDKIARQSMLIPPQGGFKVYQRRGSAPDTGRPAAHVLNGAPNLPTDQPTMQRKLPGELNLDGLLQRPKTTNASPVSSPAPVSTPGPPFPLPWMNNSSPSPKATPDQHHTRRPRPDPIRESFRPLFDFLSESFRRNNINISFSTVRKHHHARSTGEASAQNISKRSQDIRNVTPPPQITQMGHKDLMIGDVYDVASSLVTERSSPSKKQQTNGDLSAPKLVSQGSPHLDWRSLQKWYDVVLGVGRMSKESSEPSQEDSKQSENGNQDASKQAKVIEELGFQVRNALLDFSEQLLVSPQDAPKEPEEVRYLLIMLAMPLLLSPKDYPERTSRRTRSETLPSQDSQRQNSRRPSPSRNGTNTLWNSSKYSRVLSLILASLANLPVDCHNYIISWLSRYPEDMFRKHIDMLLLFINERITTRHYGSKNSRKVRKSENYNGIPTSQMFSDLLQSDYPPAKSNRSQDWQLRSACKVLQLFVRANDHFHAKPAGAKGLANMSLLTRRRPSIKQLIPTEYFYVSQLDSEEKFNARRDFDEWERKEFGLHLTQFPFLFTLGTKIQVLEFDARKKMASKARQEFFDAILRNTSVERYFHLSIRRKCIIEDSLQRISEAISSSEEEAKKALKVHFEGEEGIDAGGLRKEWFLLLVKELLDPDVGKCYNPLNLL